MMNARAVQRPLLVFLCHPVTLAAFGLAVMTLCALNARMGVNEGIWSYVGWLWDAKGLPPYAAAVENKTPGIFILYALSHHFWGVAYLPVRLAGVLAQVAGGCFLFLLCKRLYNRLAGSLAMLLFLLTNAWPGMASSWPGHPESFLILFVALAALTVHSAVRASTLRRRKALILLAGVFLGLAAAFKQIAIFDALAMLILAGAWTPPAGRTRRLVVDALFMALGFIAASIVTAVPILMAGVGGSDYFAGAWLILLNGSGNPHLGSRFLFFLRSWGEGKMLLFYPLLLLFVIQRGNLKALGIPWAALLAWLILDFVSVASSGYFYPNQVKQITPVLSIVSGLTVAAMIARYAQPLQQADKWSLVSWLLISALWLAQQAWVQGLFLTPPADPNEKVASWIRANTDPSDYIYAFSEYASPINAYAMRRSSSRHFNTIFFNKNNVLARRELEGDLAARPPKVIILGENELPAPPKWFTSLLATNYRRVFGQAPYGIYQRVEDGLRAASSPAP